MYFNGRRCAGCKLRRHRGTVLEEDHIKIKEIMPSHAKCKQTTKVQLCEIKKKSSVKWSILLSGIYELDFFKVNPFSSAIRTCHCCFNIHSIDSFTIWQSQIGFTEDPFNFCWFNASKLKRNFMEMMHFPPRTSRTWVNF